MGKPIRVSYHRVALLCALAGVVISVTFGHARTPAGGRQAVRDARAKRYDFIKVYSALDVDTFLAIADEATLQNLKVVGHIPDTFTGQLERAFVPGFGMVAHAEELSKHSDEFTDADAQRCARLAKRKSRRLNQA
jgi:hypothetical protein